MQQLEAVTVVELDNTALAHQIVDVASDRKASDVALLDVQQVTTFTDYFVIMTGTSTVHLRALSDHVARSTRELGTRPSHVEGSADDGWVLMDYGGVVVHIFTAAQREFYGLEELWSGAKTLVRIQ